MQVCFIEPLAHLEDAFATQTNWHMILPEMLHNDHYRNHYTQVGGYKLLDNGAAEGDEATWKDLLTWAYELQVDEIIVPDIMGNGAETVRRAILFEKWLRKHFKDATNDFKWQGVAHGRNLAEVVNSIRQLCTIDYIDVLGLPRLLTIQVHPFTRINVVYNPELVRLIVEHFPSGIHCLGTGPFIKEVVMLADAPVRSVDTSVVANMTLAELDIARHPRVDRPENFWYNTYPNKALAEFNHMKFIDWSIGTNWGKGGL